MPVVGVRLYTHIVRKELVNGASLYKLFNKRNVHELFGKPLRMPLDRKVGNEDLCAVAYRAFARDGVEVGIDDSVAAVVFLEDGECLVELGLTGPY